MTTYLAFPVLEALRALAEEETWPLLSGIDRTSNVVSRVNFILRNEGYITKLSKKFKPKMDIHKI